MIFSFDANMRFFNAAPFASHFSGKLRGTRLLTRLIWLAFFMAPMIFAGGARPADAAPTANRVARVLAPSAAKNRRSESVAPKEVSLAHTRRDATWRAWLLAQALALSLGLLVVARAEANEQRKSNGEARPRRHATRGAETLRTGARLALLAAFSLPIAALWLDARRSNYANSSAAQLTVALALAVLAMLCGRFRARHRGIFALLFCSAAGVFTLTFFLLGDAAARYAWTAQHAPAWLLRRGGWLEDAARETAAPQWSDVFHASHFNALNSGFFVATFLVCGVAAVLAAQNLRRKVFENPPLEVRHTHPLSTAWTSETRAQVRLLEWCGSGAIVLAVRPLGDAPLPAICLTTTAALMLWGWRHRRLDARRLPGALLGAACAAALLLLLWLGSAHLDEKFRAPREYSHSRNATGRAAAPRRATTPMATAPSSAKRVATPALQTRAATKTSSTMAGLTTAGGVALPRAAAPWRALLSDATLRGVLLIWLVLLAALLPLLRRPPPILWRVLGHSPAWAWMLLGGVLAAPLLLLAQGVVAFTVLSGTLFCAFVFVWLEGA